MGGWSATIVACEEAFEDGEVGDLYQGHGNSWDSG